MTAFLVPIDIGLSMGLIFALAVLALTLAFRLLAFPDLTVEGSLPLGAAVFAVLLQKYEAPLFVATLVGMAAGGTAGALTALLHVRFKMNKFLAGIIVVAISYSLCLRAMGTSNIGLLNEATFFDIAKPLDGVGGSKFHLGTALLLMAIVAVISSLFAFGLASRRGMQLRAAGTNPEYARSLGINVPANMIIGLALTNSMAALSGILLAMNQGFADVGMGQGTLILALAAMTLGERLLPERVLPYHVFVVLSAIIGSIAYQVIVAAAVRMGLAPTDLKLVTAVIVLIVVALRISRDNDLLGEGIG